MFELMMVAIGAAVAAACLLIGYRWGWASGRADGIAAARRLDPNRRLQSSILAMTLGDRAAALAELAAATRQDIREVGPYIALGDLLRESGRPDHARYVHEMLLTRRAMDGEERCRLLISVAEDLLALGRQGQAILCLQDALRHRPNDLTALGRLRGIYEEAANWKGAQMIVARIERATDTSLAVETAYLNARVALDEERRGNLREALRLYRRAAKERGDCVPAQRGVGRMLLRLGREAEALHSWTAFVDAKPGLAYALLDDLGELICTAKDQQARAGLSALAERIVRLAGSGDSAGALGKAARFLEKVGRPSEALALLRAHQALPGLLDVLASASVGDGNAPEIETRALLARYAPENPRALVTCPACGGLTAADDRCDCCHRWHAPHRAVELAGANRSA